MADIVTVEAGSALRIAQTRELFLEYTDWLNVDLTFQNFTEELARLPGDYASPDGRLYLALVDGQAAGCIALRRFDGSTGEVKRMWVRPPFRGQGIARELTRRLMAAAREAGYARLMLDTLGHMAGAIALYRSMGFHDIPAYYDNPIPGMIYMACELQARAI